MPTLPQKILKLYAGNRILNALILANVHIFAVLELFENCFKLLNLLNSYSFCCDEFVIIFWNLCFVQFLVTRNILLDYNAIIFNFLFFLCFQKLPIYFYKINHKYFVLIIYLFSKFHEISSATIVCFIY